jgi:hypothetical protein
MNFINREFPAMQPRLEQLYARKSAPAAYRNEVKAMVHVLQSRYGLARRDDVDSVAEPAGSPELDAEQAGFAWD